MPAIVERDAVCRRLLTVPGIGALVSIAFKSTIDAPGGTGDLGFGFIAWAW